MRALSFRDRMREEAAKAAAAETADPWQLRLERVRGKVDFFDHLERVSSQTLLDLLEVLQRNRTPARFVVLQRLWRSLAGRPCGSAALPAAAILNKCAGTAVNRSVTHNQQVASADHVDLFLPTNSKKVKR